MALRRGRGAKLLRGGGEGKKGLTLNSGFANSYWGPQGEGGKREVSKKNKEEKEDLHQTISPIQKQLFRQKKGKVRRPGKIISPASGQERKEGRNISATKEGGGRGS